MVEAAGLIILGALMVLLAPFGHFHWSWKSPWQFAGWGVLLVLLGGVAFLFEIWQSP